MLSVEVPMNDVAKVETSVQDYYNSEDAFRFYTLLWGGLHIHVGVYLPEEIAAPPALSIVRDATVRSCDRMAAGLRALQGPLERVADLGSGVGGTARHVARVFPTVRIDCFDISAKENAENARLNGVAGLDDRITVHTRSYLDTGAADGAFDAVMSMDAFLHCPDRDRLLAEASRLLRPGGVLVFTDLMQEDDRITDNDRPLMTSIYERLSLRSMASVDFYRRAAAKVGFEFVRFDDHRVCIAKHYSSVRDLILEHGSQHGISASYIERMANGCTQWVVGAEREILTWGFVHFVKN